MGSKQDNLRIRIGSVPRLTLRALEFVRPGDDPFAKCHTCGGPAGDRPLLYRECDAKDQKIQGPIGLLVSCGSAACEKIVEDHPRLYLPEQGDPGSFPLICPPCVHRDGWKCSHPDAKTNGGPGVQIQLGFLCARGRKRQLSERPAFSCSGREVSPPESCRRGKTERGAGGA